jgi:hypothetical protein
VNLRLNFEFELLPDQREDIRQTQIAATAGDEAAVQKAFANWDQTGRVRDPRGAGRLRIHRPPPESNSTPGG